MADHEAHHRQTGHVDQVAVGPHSHVVAEPLAHLVRVGHAPDPREERHVEDRGPLVVGQALELRHPQCDEGLADDVLLRLTEPQIRRER